MTNGTNGWKIYLRTCQCSTTGTGTGNGTAAPAFKAFEDRDELKGQVNLWVASESNRSAIEAKYGPITSWDVSSVTDMEVRHSALCRRARARLLDRLLALGSMVVLCLLTCWGCVAPHRLGAGNVFLLRGPTLYV